MNYSLKLFGGFGEILYLCNAFRDVLRTWMVMDGK